MPVDTEKDAEGSLIDVVNLFDPGFVRLALNEVHGPLGVEIKPGYRVLYLMVVENTLLRSGRCFIKHFCIGHSDICVKFAVWRRVRQGLRGKTANCTPSQGDEAEEAYHLLNHRRQQSLPRNKGRREE